MKIVLKRLTQDVDLDDLEGGGNFLVLSMEEVESLPGATHEFRIPVSAETVQALVSEIHAHKNGPAFKQKGHVDFSDPSFNEQPEQTEEEGATEFGNEEDEQFEGPSDEDQVRSL